MSRLIFLFAIAAVIYLLIKSFRKNLPEENMGKTEDMVCCAHCGLHLPAGESISANGLQFCCAAHRDACLK